MTFYISGFIVTGILILILLYYFGHIKQENIDCIGNSVWLCFGSWVVAVIIVIIYRDAFVEVFKHIFKR